MYTVPTDDIQLMNLVHNIAALRRQHGLNLHDYFRIFFRELFNTRL